MKNADKTIRRFGTTLRLEFLSGRIRYELKHGRKVIFTGQDFRPSPLYSWDSVGTYCSLMSFLTLQKGDTDAEYFENYTADQFAFADSASADKWRMYLYELESHK